MCQVHVISDRALTAEEREQLRIGINGKYACPTIKFFSEDNKKLKKQLKKYLNRHPRSHSEVCKN